MKSLLNLKKGIAKDRFTVGIDIGSKTVKLVKLRHAQDAVELCSYELISLPASLGDAFRKFADPKGVDSVIIGISGPSAIIRYVHFPRMNEAELRQALKFEAQKHIPFSVNEVNLDGYILKEDLPNNKMLVLIAAAKKEVVSQKIKLLENAGFSTNIVDMDSLALINAFNFNYAKEEDIKHKTVALLNIGASVSNLNILEGNFPRLSRDIHVAGTNFTQRICDVFSVDFDAAEKLKITPDKEKEEKIQAGVEPVIANLATELRTSFDYYESQSASSLSKIFLSGAGSNFSGLKDALANFLGIEVDYWDPLKEIKLIQELDSSGIKQQANQFCVAIGLALR